MIGVHRRKEESDKNYFEGTGYARVPTQPNAPFPTFGQTIQTTVDRGLLFFAENQVIYNKHPDTTKYVHSFEQFGGNWVITNNQRIWKTMCEC